MFYSREGMAQQWYSFIAGDMFCNFDTLIKATLAKPLPMQRDGDDAIRPVLACCYTGDKQLGQQTSIVHLLLKFKPCQPVFYRGVRVKSNARGIVPRQCFFAVVAKQPLPRECERPIA